MWRDASGGPPMALSCSVWVQECTPPCTGCIHPQEVTQQKCLKSKDIILNTLVEPELEGTAEGLGIGRERSLSWGPTMEGVTHCQWLQIYPQMAVNLAGKAYQSDESLQMMASDAAYVQKLAGRQQNLVSDVLRYLPVASLRVPQKANH